MRALYQVRADGPRGAEKLRLAAALRPPGSARLEFLGPLGGPRLIVTTDGRHATAVLPSERQYDVAADRPASMRRLLGLPIDGERLIALLSGKPPCEPERAGSQAEAQGAGARLEDAGTHDESGLFSCDQDGIRFAGRRALPDGLMRRVALLDLKDGAVVAEIDYEAASAPGADAPWPRALDIDLKESRTRIHLEILEGPAKGPLADDLFAPDLPEDFARRAIFAAPGDPAFYAPAGGGAR